MPKMKALIMNFEKRILAEESTFPGLANLN
jgi:hypothetical protein